MLEEKKDDNAPLAGMASEKRSSMTHHLRHYKCITQDSHLKAGPERLHNAEKTTMNSCLLVPSCDPKIIATWV